ncbi:hypothetical protein BT96DRAFT_1060114 [Gymnopus androsaceus JB14]|uniref:Zn(2)-C6 fungal-type domain-containing protein n=1 Tax=Gymnopus androsaceus JB14 TaxID=1447944 RepID=A0A6A4H076_9AGAR|nr:hypothetical protein BT96DRAFT_1060114 [Gymnopus androsaceus JB14]
MSLEVRKAQAPSERQPATRGNDYKRRRNRAILSCLGCHTSKRMCDRKRPKCTRCTEMGLTGHCVYEVDESSQRLNTQNRFSILRNRVAELEGEIEELKNKQNPSPEQHDAADLLNINTDPHFVGYEDNVEMYNQLDSISPESSHRCNPSQGIKQCSCVMLELSLRLRKAVAILAQHPHHQAGRYCPLNQTLVELDTLTADGLSSDSPRAPSYSQAPALPTPHAINTHSNLTRLDLDSLFNSSAGNGSLTS